MLVHLCWVLGDRFKVVFFNYILFACKHNYTYCLCSGIILIYKITGDSSNYLSFLNLKCNTILHVPGISCVSFCYLVHSTFAMFLPEDIGVKSEYCVMFRDDKADKCQFAQSFIISCCICHQLICVSPVYG